MYELEHLKQILTPHPPNKPPRYNNNKKTIKANASCQNNVIPMASTKKPSGSILISFDTFWYQEGL